MGKDDEVEVTVEATEPTCTICNDERIVFIHGRPAPCRCAQ